MSNTIKTPMELQSNVSVLQTNVNTLETNVQSIEAGSTSVGYANTAAHANVADVANSVTMANVTGLNAALANKQSKLTAVNGISIVGNDIGISNNGFILLKQVTETHPYDYRSAIMQPCEIAISQYGYEDPEEEYGFVERKTNITGCGISVVSSSEITSEPYYFSKMQSNCISVYYSPDETGTQQTTTTIASNCIEFIYEDTGASYTTKLIWPDSAYESSSCQIYHFPDKYNGTYTLATTADIDVNKAYVDNALANKQATINASNKLDYVYLSNTPTIFDPNTTQVQIGSSANASGDNSTALGSGTNASCQFSTALGYMANASGIGSTALGTWTEASGQFSTALGRSAEACSYCSTAVGDSAKASGEYSTALGFWTNALGNCSTALGQHTSANSDYSIAIGYHAKVNDGDSAIALGFYTHAECCGSMALGVCANASSEVSIAVGDSTEASGNGSTALGFSASANSDYSIAIGYHAKVNDGDSAIALGFYTHAECCGSTALGSSANASGNDSTAVGLGTNASGNYSTALGYWAKATATNAVQIGRGTNPNANSLQFRDTVVVDGNGKINADTLNNQAASFYLPATKCTYQTTEPTEAIADGGVHIVYLSAEPTAKYSGYIYMIAE